jgi:hypothetical protein
MSTVAIAAAGNANTNGTAVPGIDPAMRPLPVWFFGFEGVLGAAYDLCHANPELLPVVLAVGALNMAVSFTVIGKRRKLLRAMLKNSRTRFIAIGLVALRFGVHLLFGLLGTAFAGATGHYALAALMSVTTVAMLWFDQRITFRALGLTAR